MIFKYSENGLDATVQVERNAETDNVTTTYVVGENNPVTNSVRLQGYCISCCVFIGMYDNVINRCRIEAQDVWAAIVEQEGDCKCD